MHKYGPNYIIFGLILIKKYLTITMVRSFIKRMEENRRNI